MRVHSMYFLAPSPVFGIIIEVHLGGYQNTSAYCIIHATFKFLLFIVYQLFNWCFLATYHLHFSFKLVHWSSLILDCFHWFSSLILMSLYNDDECIIVTQTRPDEVTLLFKRNVDFTIPFCFSEGEWEEILYHTYTFVSEGDDASGYKGMEVCVHIKKLLFCLKWL